MPGEKPQTPSKIRLDLFHPAYSGGRHSDGYAVPGIAVRLRRLSGWGKGFWVFAAQLGWWDGMSLVERRMKGSVWTD